MQPHTAEGIVVSAECHFCDILRLGVRMGHVTADARAYGRRLGTPRMLWVVPDARMAIEWRASPSVGRPGRCQLGFNIQLTVKVDQNDRRMATRGLHRWCLRLGCIAWVLQASAMCLVRGCRRSARCTTAVLVKP